MSSNSTMAFILKLLLCLVSMSAIQVYLPQEAAGFKLTMTPEHYQEINAHKTPAFNVMCVLRDSARQPVPLTGCGFKEVLHNITIQFNEGPASPNYTANTDINGDTLTITYHGRGLERGECGVTLAGYANGHTYILGCRVRPFKNIFQIATMLLYVTEYTPMQYRLKPPGVTLALAGSEVTIKGKAEHELDMCGFHLPPANNPVFLNFTSGPASANDSVARYHGAGLDNKECGITLLNVQPERSGFVNGAVVRKFPRRRSDDFIELIVASPPDEVGMTKTATREGGILKATCWSRNSRPVANITWLLDDKVIRQDSNNEGAVETEWLWNHDPQSITQQLLLHVTREDNGKELVCRVGHFALPFGVVNISETVYVNAKYMDFKTHFIIAVVICGLLVVALGVLVGFLWFYKQLCWSDYFRPF